MLESRHQVDFDKINDTPLYRDIIDMLSASSLYYGHNFGDLDNSIHYDHPDCIPNMIGF